MRLLWRILFTSVGLTNQGALAMSVPDMPDGQPLPSLAFTARISVALPFPPLPTGHSRRSERAVVTWVAGEAAYRWFSVTGSAMKLYADRVGADFIALEGFAGQPYPLVNKFRVRQVFEEYGYETVLYVDVDALIRDHCVDLFELVPPGKVGILDEAPHKDEWMLADFRREALALLVSQDCDADWEDLPTPKNSGLYVMPAAHSNALQPFIKPFPLCSRNGATVEQTWLTLNLHHNAAPLFELTHPDQHWLWYADQAEDHADHAMVLHFSGLRDRDDLRYRRLLHHASTRPRGRGRQIPNAVPTFDRQMMLDQPAPAALKMIGTRTIQTHRYGWRVAIRALSVLAETEGVLFDGWVENTFLWHVADSRRARRIPYDEPWVGFVHNPPGVPDWPSIRESRIQALNDNPEWLDSLDKCLGLFTLSEYLAHWVRREWRVPCEVLRYPTLVPERRFSIARYESAAPKRVAMIGFWLRRFSSFALLDADGHRKIRPLLADPRAPGGARMRAYEREEAGLRRVNGDSNGTVEVWQRLSGGEYDDLLSTSVVFLDLIDASAVTTIVECMARGTPVLVNRLPAVVEYLGDDYPFYFESLDDAAAKLADPAAVRAAHESLESNPVRERLRPQAFLDSFAKTSIYQRVLSTAPLSCV
jgi:hypothetical protein